MFVVKSIHIQINSQVMDLSIDCFLTRYDWVICEIELIMRLTAITVCNQSSRIKLSVVMETPVRVSNFLFSTYFDQTIIMTSFWMICTVVPCIMQIFKLINVCSVLTFFTSTAKEKEALFGFWQRLTGSLSEVSRQHGATKLKKPFGTYKKLW